MRSINSPNIEMDIWKKTRELYGVGLGYGYARSIRLDRESDTTWRASRKDALNPEHV
jgi:hypothetical protein